MRILKIYLETTMFNYFFDTGRDAHPDTVKLFEEIAQGKYEAFTSDAVLEELGKAPEEKRNLMIGLIEKYHITVLSVTLNAVELADVYVKESIIPLRFHTDGVHIAVATVNNLDMIISLNFKHIVRRKTIELSEYINIKEGYKKIRIYTPMEVVEYDDEL